MPPAANRSYPAGGDVVPPGLADSAKISKSLAEMANVPVSRALEVLKACRDNVNEALDKLLSEISDSASTQTTTTAVTTTTTISRQGPTAGNGIHHRKPEPRKKEGRAETDKKKGVCAVCMDDTVLGVGTKPISSFSCGHWLCQDCADKFSRNNGGGTFPCHMCRKPVHSTTKLFV